MEQSERQPLLSSSSQNNDPQPISLGGPRVERPTEFPGSLPGSSPGKNLTWTSAYILVVSRVIGSGIFATPGSIVKSAGSIGLTLLVWIFGTILAACGMAISMEYGCMLPRSGGDKVSIEFHPGLPKREHRLRFTPVCRYTWSTLIPDPGFSRLRSSPCKQSCWGSLLAIV